MPDVPDELRGLALHEPLTCRGCLAMPLTVCPRVRASAAAGKLDTLLVRSYSTDMLYCGRVFGGTEADQVITDALIAANVNRAVSFVEIIPEEYERVTIAQLYAAAGLVAP